ncbi:MAG: hypothetical protein U5K33_04320 [Halofilum sp. (in: g-proteobacteria)]|nr:hypothetical protein [Halofilum sp. (in: g-proteobacteria)]
MNCERFRMQWTEWREGLLESGADEMARHRESCTACAGYDRQMRRLISELGQLPLPERGTAPAPAAVRHAGGPRWIALAATLVVGIALGFLLGDRGGDGGMIVAEPVALEGAGTQRIAIAIESRRAYEEVDFVVELPAGVELAGHPGQRSVRWTGSLAEGRSRLQLPLQIMPGSEGGRLVTRIVRPDGERRLVVPLESGNGIDSAARGTLAA